MRGGGRLGRCAASRFSVKPRCCLPKLHPLAQAGPVHFRILGLVLVCPGL